MAYHYALTSGEKTDNRLLYVDDTEAPPANYPGEFLGQNSGNYTYDAVGNMTQDIASKIDAITWDLQKKVRHVERANTGNKTEPCAELPIGKSKYVVLGSLS